MAPGGDSWHRSPTLFHMQELPRGDSWNEEARLLREAPPSVRIGRCNRKRFGGISAERFPVLAVSSLTHYPRITLERSEENRRFPTSSRRGLTFENLQPIRRFPREMETDRGGPSLPQSSTHAAPEGLRTFASQLQTRTLERNHSGAKVPMK